jgi:uncharacterized protein (TIRG00374 family)
VPTPSSASPIRWHTFFIAALTIGLLWWFFRDLNVREAWDAIRSAHWALIVLAVLSVGLTYLLRAWRWLILLRPLGPARFQTALRTTIIGFMALALLPARLGEVLRAYLLARRENLPPASTFATVIVERLLDMTSVLLLFAVALPFGGVEVAHSIKVASAVFGALVAAGLFVLFLLAGHPERLGRWAGSVTRHLPTKLSDMVTHFMRTFAEGLKVMRSPGHLAYAMLWSVPVWMSIALTIWLTSRAFGLTVSVVGSFLVVGYLALGVSLPTPGGAGGFEWAYQLSVTQFFGASEAVAKTAAVVLHLVSFGPVTIAGLILMWQDGLTLGSLKGLKAEAKAAEEVKGP